MRLLYFIFATLMINVGCESDLTNKDNRKFRSGSKKSNTLHAKKLSNSEDTKLQSIYLCESENSYVRTSWRDGARGLVLVHLRSLSLSLSLCFQCPFLGNPCARCTPLRRNFSASATPLTSSTTLSSFWTTSAAVNSVQPKCPFTRPIFV